MLLNRKFWPILALATVLLLMTGITLKPYHWNVTAIFHMDKVLEDANGLPPGFVVLSVPSYDGAQYYQVARNLPKIFSPSRWAELREKAPGSYAYQRFLLPLLAGTLSFGHDSALPYLFLGINLISLILACWVFLRWQSGKPLYALALCFSPAAMVALHFSLAEPLTILLITLALVNYLEHGKFGPLDVLYLSLLVLAREVNILFIVYLLIFSAWRRNWRDALFLLIPAFVFLGWHSVIYAIFHNVPFLISTGARQIPGSAALKLLFGLKGFNQLTLSAIVLFLGLVLPGFVWMGYEMCKRRSFDILSAGAFVFLGVMLTMPDYIWGSITSIGRVITPAYPLLLMYCSVRDTRPARFLAIMTLLIGIGASIGLALSVHPFVISGN
jgi:hypothetical protein